jgi:hypothetical protein
MTTRPRHALILKRVALAVAATALLLPAVASAFTSFYGGYTICGSSQATCYISTFDAHTYVKNNGSSIGSATYLACQLFNHSGGANVVTHGYGKCVVYYSGGQYVWGRVYNESAFSDTVYGAANTG